jgi:hypothetical protein
MPTGYTAAIADGIEFETFVMRCSRGMGALVMMRDEPMDAPIPERFEPSDYHTRKLRELNEELAKLRTVSHEEAEAEANKDFDAEKKANSEAIERNRELRGKYETMLAKVEAWEQPTPDHDGLKKFMVDQLIESISFDCNESYYEARSPKQKTGSEWLANQIAKATRDVEYHAAEHAKEVERTEIRNKWLHDLRNSITTSA